MTKSYLFILSQIIILLSSTAFARPLCACNPWDLSCSTPDQYEYFRVDSCDMTTGFVAHVCECRDKPANACIPRIETHSFTDISGSSCGTGGHYECVLPNNGVPLSYACFCVDCSAAPAGCITQTQTFEVTRLPTEFTLNNDDIACGRPPGAAATRQITIDRISFEFPLSVTPSLIQSIPARFTHTWNIPHPTPP